MESYAPSTVSWVIWQLLDSNLPTGGFAHSYGLEAALQLKHFDLQSVDEEIRVTGLLAFARQTMEQQASLLLPMVSAAHHAAKDATALLKCTDAGSSVSMVSRWATLDKECHALITTEGGRRASTAQGLALLRLACDNIPSLSSQHCQWLRTARDLIRGRVGYRYRDDAAGESESLGVSHDMSILSARGHQAPVFGWLCQALGVDAVTCFRMFCYLVLRDLMAAATRLGLVGPLAAVRLQMTLYGDAEAVVGRFLEQEASERATGGKEGGRGPRQENPLLDILQGAHEKLYSRLFIS